MLPALGGVIGRDRKLISEWVRKYSKSAHTSLFSYILDPSLPSQHAYTLLRMCVLPKMNYFSRIFPPEVLSPSAKAFDAQVLDTFCNKLLLPTLDSAAREQLSMPIYLGGFGLKSIRKVSMISIFT